MNVLTRQPHLQWAVLPIGLQAFGIALNQPFLTLLALDRFPRHRGAASSVQGFLALSANATVSGIVSPLVSLSPFTLSAAVLAVRCGRILPMAAERAIRRGGDASRRRGCDERFGVNEPVSLKNL